VSLLISGMTGFSSQTMASVVNVGDIYYLSQPNGTTQFFIDNFTGPADGCSTPNGFPICTPLSMTGTLTYSYLDNASVVVTGAVSLLTELGTNIDNNGASYQPPNFVLPTTALISGTFSGTIAPANFTTDTGAFQSTGIVLSNADVVANGGFAVLVTDSAPVPEPWGGPLVFASLCVVVRLRNQHLRPGKGHSDVCE
jgi:hypothetical protein